MSLLTEENLPTWPAGDYEITYTDDMGDQRTEEVHFKGGVKNINSFFTSIGSDGGLATIDNIFDGPVYIKPIDTDQDAPQQHMLSAAQGHCVGRYGISEHLKCLVKNRKTGSSRNALRKYADRIADYIDQNYPNGVNMEDPAFHKFCYDNKLHLTVNMVTYGKIIDVPDPKVYKTSNADYHIKFINARKNHVDLIYPGIPNTVEFLEEHEMHKKLDELRTMGAVLIHKTRVCIAKKTKTEPAKWTNPIIWKMQYLGNSYIMKGFEHRLVTSINLKEAMGNTYRYFNDSRAPYYNFIRHSIHIPCHSFKKEAYKPGSFDIAEYPQDHVKAQFREDMYQTDMHSCYKQYTLCKYYMGFPIAPSDYRWNPTYEFASKKAGWWLIKSDGTLPFVDRIGGLVWTTPSLRFFHDMGIEFKITFGCWDDNPLPELEMPQDKDAYCIYSGLLARERDEVRTRWIDDSGLITRDEQHKGEKLQTSRNEQWYSGGNLASYIYSYASVQILDAAIRHNALGITVDCIWTLEPVVLPGTATDGKPLWSIPDKTVPLTGSYKTMSPRYLSGTGDYYDTKYPIAFPPKEFPGLEHVIPSGDVLLKGLGGSGKSYAAHKCLEWLAPVYVAPTDDLIQDKHKDGWLFNSTDKSFSACKNNYIERHIPRVVFMDEINLMGSKDLVRNLAVCQEYGIRIILAGDEAQIQSQFAKPDVWNYVTGFVDNTVVFKTDRRSQDAKLRNMKAKLRDIVLSGLPQDEKILEIRRIVKTAKHPNAELRDKLPWIKKYKHDESKHGPLPKGGCKTVDSMQGQDVTEPTICNINKHTRTDQFPELVYTMISRFRRWSDLYVTDNSAYVGPKEEKIQVKVIKK